MCLWAIVGNRWQAGYGGLRRTVKAGSGRMGRGGNADGGASRRLGWIWKVVVRRGRGDKVGSDAGPRVLSFESRRQREMADLISRHGGQATVVASMQETPLSDNHKALSFVEALRNGTVDTVVFFTGVGARTLAESVAGECPIDELAQLLNECTIVVRGPKPSVVLKNWGVRIDGRAAEPNTWEELLPELERLDSVRGRCVAVQEYGVPNVAFYDAISVRDGRVMPVPVYRWSLPEDTGPLEQGIRDTVAGGFDVLLFTSAQQLTNVLTVADRLGLEEAWRRSAACCLIGSVGPTATSALQSSGVRVDIEPAHPKMGPLVRETLLEAISRTRPPSSRGER